MLLWFLLGSNKFAFATLLASKFVLLSRDLIGVTVIKLRL